MVLSLLFGDYNALRNGLKSKLVCEFQNTPPLSHSSDSDLPKNTLPIRDASVMQSIDSEISEAYNASILEFKSAERSPAALNSPQYAHFDYEVKRSTTQHENSLISSADLVSFENRIKSILVDPGPEFLKNIQALAETIIFCRDRKRGCGLRDDAYQMLFIWYKYFPDWALRLFGRFVYEGVGSWADVKYLCGYLASIRCDDSFVSTCVENFTNALIDRMNTQIESDRLQWDLAISDYLEKRDVIFSEGIDVSLLGGLPKRPRALETISMAVKWVPRESSKYRWLFEKMVLRWGRKYHPNYFVKLDGGDKENYPDIWSHQKRVLNKLSMMYRKMVASLSKEIIYDLHQLQDSQRES
jgi:hypothetical protein